MDQTQLLHLATALGYAACLQGKSVLFTTAIDAINTSGKRIFALDLPSGMDCDSGLPLGTCVRASHTATFVARKPGFDQPDAGPFTGTVHVIDIGVPGKLLEEVVSGSCS